MNHSILSPESEEVLWQRASTLANKTIGELAALYGIQLPENFRREKGFIGQLLERALGTTAGNLAQPDFPHLGIELKTIPLHANGKPKESTYVTIVPLMVMKLMTWHDSEVYQKLRRVLWIPYFFDKAIAPHHWRLSQPILWSPNAEEEAILKEDWHDLMSLVQLGQLDKINARLGQYLQVRPKGMHAGVRTRGIGQEGQCVRTSPLGFYLRTAFTDKIVRYSR